MQPVPVARARRWLRRNRWRLLGAVVACCLLAAGGFVAYFSTPHHARAGALDDLRANEDVRLSTTDGTYVLAPVGGSDGGDPTAGGGSGPRAGLVFYPGGRVHPDAYLPSLAPLAAEAGVTVFVTQPPLNLAVLDQGAAAGVIDRHPGVDRWYVGGHSLGGAMACRYAAGNADRVDGLVLFASYCDRNVSASGLRVLSVTGSADAVLNRDRYRETRSNLPPDATVVELDGVNHSQFGAYTGQRGGRPSGTSYAVAHDRLAEVLVPWFRRAGAGGGAGSGDEAESGDGAATVRPAAPSDL